MSDNPFLKRILLACSNGRARLFRNNVGRGWVGKSEVISAPRTVRVEAGDVVVRNARPLHAGLMEGSGDLIGWVSRTIEPQHVGETWAVFASLEAKEGTGRLEPPQRAWMGAVRAAGGVAGEVRTVDAAADLLAASVGAQAAPLREAKVVGALPDWLKVIGMTAFDGMPLIATTAGVYRIDAEAGELVLIPMRPEPMA